MNKTMRCILGAAAFLSVWAQVSSASACDCPDGGCGCVAKAIQPKASGLASKIEAILRARGNSDQLSSITVVLVPKPTTAAPKKALKCVATTTGAVCSRD